MRDRYASPPFVERVSCSECSRVRHESESRHVNRNAKHECVTTALRRRLFAGYLKNVLQITRFNRPRTLQADVYRIQSSDDDDVYTGFLL